VQHKPLSITMNVGFARSELTFSVVNFSLGRSWSHRWQTGSN
jgi:hypothetical protein